MDQVALATIVSFALIVTGVAGLLLPALPGAVMIWLGIVAFGLLAPDVHWPISFYIAQGLLALSTYIIDYLATVWGVKKFKGSKAGAIGAVVGMLLVFVMGPLGIIIGPFVGAIAGELIAGGELRQALTSGFGSFVGFIVATFLRLLVCGIMISWFLYKAVSSVSVSLPF